MRRCLIYILGIWMVLVTVAIYLYAPTAMGLGHLSRIIYFHVPLAWVGVIAYFASMYYSYLYLKRKKLSDDLFAAANAEIGIIFTILATITGAIFARNTWGVYWNWDPRQTSIFILLLIYCSYFLLRSAVEEFEKKGRLASVFSILAFLTVPFLVFIIPRVYASLHPDPIISMETGFKMDAKMLRVFLASLLGFTGIYIWVASLYARYISFQVGRKGDYADE